MVMPVVSCQSKTKKVNKQNDNLTPISVIAACPQSFFERKIPDKRE
jgi:hypothetical protein